MNGTINKEDNIQILSTKVNDGRNAIKYRENRKVIGKGAIIQHIIRPLGTTSWQIGCQSNG